jgi:hypothetical protein
MEQSKIVTVAGQPATLRSWDGGRTWWTSKEAAEASQAARSVRRAARKTARHCSVAGCWNPATEWIGSPERVCDIHFWE